MTASLQRANQRLHRAAFHAAGRGALRVFERRARQARRSNARTLAAIVKTNAATEFGRAHDFASLASAADLPGEFRRRVPLSTHTDYAEAVARVARGEPNVLTADAVVAIVGSAGTTGAPKRIPRTARAQRQTMFLVALAEQGILDRTYPGTWRQRGISLMSAYQRPTHQTVSLQSGPNVGMARMRRYMPALWVTPPPVYAVADQPTALYLHALFGLQEPNALYISIPFAPQLVAWFAQIEQHQTDLVRAMHDGQLPAELKLSVTERQAIAGYLMPNPMRARELERLFSAGFDGIVPRLWPGMRYVRTVTSGAFALAVERLQALCTGQVLIYSGCHSSTEGILGINRRTDGTSEYTLACGNAFFEFIPESTMTADQPETLTPGELTIGGRYELVLTNCSGLYRYRLGDVIEVTGFFGEAPVYRPLYRAGTVINLAGEKSSEAHTRQAVQQAWQQVFGRRLTLHDYTLAPDMIDGIGRYRIYLEAREAGRVSPAELDRLAAAIDSALGEINPYYRSMGRDVGRLLPVTVRWLAPGAFERLLTCQRRRGAPEQQAKVPRLLRDPAQQSLLEAAVVDPAIDTESPTAARDTVAT